MLAFLHRDLLPNPETFGQLIIDRRVLVTPRSTISIANVTIVDVRSVTTPRKYAWNGALFLLGAGLIFLAAGLTQHHNVGTAVGAVGMLGGFVLGRYFSKSETPCLAIASSDGHTALFTGQPHTLEEVRRLLTDKINTDDDSALYRINFERGVIQSMSLGHAEPVAAITNGTGHHVAPALPNGRLAHHDGYLAAPSLPMALNGNGHYPAANGYHIDYALVLPQIADMQRFYAQRPDTQDIADRLSEMEHLMRSGTPTLAGRSRLSQLVAELSSMLGAYPAVVQIFQQAGRLAGH